MGLRIPSNKTLFKVTVYGAIITISAGMFMRMKIEDRIRNQDYFKDAIKILCKNPGAVRLLGEPIREKGIDISSDKKTFCDGQKVHMEVGVKGTRDVGTMFFWSERDENVWKLQKMELEIKSHPDKRFIIVKQASNSTE